MNLLIIIISLLSERYLIHTLSSTRFNWFSSYVEKLTARFFNATVTQKAYLALLIIVLPLLLIVWIIFAFIGHVLFGLFGFLISLVIFYYCLGPENPFYPRSAPHDALENELAAGDYFAKVNNQLFAPIFWFIIIGPLGVLFYRLVSLCIHYEITKKAALNLINGLDWPTSRVTLMLYLFVGNFQQGFNYYRQMFLSSPQHNEVMLSKGGLIAAHSQEDEMITLPYAQHLVEQALVVYLVLIAIITLSLS